MTEGSETLTDLGELELGEGWGKGHWSYQGAACGWWAEGCLFRVGWDNRHLGRIGRGGQVETVTSLSRGHTSSTDFNVCSILIDSTWRKRLSLQQGRLVILKAALGSQRGQLLTFSAVVFHKARLDLREGLCGGRGVSAGENRCRGGTFEGRPVKEGQPVPIGGRVLVTSERTARSWTQSGPAIEPKEQHPPGWGHLRRGL